MNALTFPQTFPRCLNLQQRSHLCWPLHLKPLSTKKRANKAAHPLLTKKARKVAATNSSESLPSRMIQHANTFGVVCSFGRGLKKIFLVVLFFREESEIPVKFLLLLFASFDEFKGESPLFGEMFWLFLFFAEVSLTFRLMVPFSRLTCETALDLFIYVFKSIHLLRAGTAE